MSLKTKIKILFLIFGLFFLLACAPVVSTKLKQAIDKTFSLSVVSKNPDSFIGKSVLWSGVIIKAVNVKEGTIIEVLQQPTDARGKPKKVDKSEGRFLALYEGYLDVAIYSEGRKVTVAGEVKGKRIRRLGEIDYTYPLLAVKEIHLWPREKEERIYHHHPYPYWYHHWWYPPYYDFQG